MKLLCKYTFYLLILSPALSSCGEKEKIQETVYSQKMIETVAFKTFLSNKREQKLATAHWDYVPGLVAVSVLKAWQQYPDKQQYYDVVKAYADFCLQGTDTVKVGESNIDDLALVKYSLHFMRMKLTMAILRMHNVIRLVLLT